MKDADVIVVGGGPAGMMAAAAAAGAGARVLLLEKGDRLGRKLVISGGGRCNVTNRKPVPDLIRNIPGNGRFLYSALSQFGSEEIIRFFEELGIRLKEEDGGRMFPATDRAATVLAALVKHLRDLGVQIRLRAPVARLLLDDRRCAGVVLQSGESLRAPAVVVATGGKSVPKTGSTGDGYAWARAAGHTITPLYPTAVPLLLGDPPIQDRWLQGISLRDVTMTLYDPRGKRLATERGDMIFTHFGVSGPCALRVSHYVSVARMKLGDVPLPLHIDLFPDRSQEELIREICTQAAAEPKKAVKTVLRRLLPDRLVPLVLEKAKLPGETTGAHLPRAGVTAVVQLLKALPFTVTGTRPLEEAFVTGGGVSIREIDPRTMASRLKEGLFFAGEVMDVHGHTGGYNITIAFSTGHAAGTAAARLALEKSGE
ncbi:MAG TPA: NAD(P)/FAD-dependent oxidoreductase [Symbiobacteriaceae bacterium]